MRLPNIDLTELSDISASFRSILVGHIFEGIPHRSLILSTAILILALRLAADIFAPIKAAPLIRACFQASKISRTVIFFHV